MKNRYFPRLKFSLVIFLLSCAAIGPPSGGPEDTTPPNLISLQPKKGSLHFKGGEVHMAFSEYISENSIEKAIQVSPKLEELLPFHYKGKEIIFHFPEKLDSNQTYVFTLSRQLKDEHGIPLAKPIQVAYSTGDVIDKGRLSGTVFGEGPFSVHLWNSLNTDSLFANEPDYVTDAADDGEFQFQYLAPGPYTLLAVDQRGAGLGLDPNRTAYGVTQVSSVFLEQDGHIAKLRIRVENEPQTLQLKRGEWLGNRWGRLYFNREIEDSAVFNSVVLNQNEIKSQAKIYRDLTDKSRLLLVGSDSLSPGKLAIEVSNIFIRDSILLDSAKISVRVPVKPDTSYLKFVKPHPSTGFQPDDEGGPSYPLVFSKPVFSISDTALHITQNDTEQVSIRLDWVSPIHLNIYPDSGWIQKTKYTLSLLSEGLEVIEGRSFKDSLTVKSFNTKRNRGYGDLLGTVVDSLHYPLVAVLNSLKNPHDSFTEVVNSKFQFHYKHVPEGPYQIMLFEDRDKNGTYTFGKAYPFQPSEWFYFHEDTLEVRANWEIDLSPIIIK